MEDHVQGGRARKIVPQRVASWHSAPKSALLRIRPVSPARVPSITNGLQVADSDMWRQLLGGSQQWLAKVAGLNGMAVTPFVCTSFQEGAHWSPVDVLAHLDHDSMLEALDTLSDEGNAEVRQAQDSLASRLYGSKNTRPMPKVKCLKESPAGIPHPNLHCFASDLYRLLVFQALQTVFR